MRKLEIILYSKKSFIITAVLLILLLIVSLEHVSMPLTNEWGISEEQKNNTPELEPLAIPNQIDKHRIPAMETTKVGNVTGYDSMDVVIAGTIAYVADVFGLIIIDISDVTSPKTLGIFDDFGAGAAHGVAVSGPYAYVAAGYDGLEIIDISTPSSPAEVGQFNDGGVGYAHGVAVNGSYAYVADGDDGLEIIDISTPSSPVEVGQFNDGGVGYAHGVAVSGSYAYVADGFIGLEIIDISTPSSPVEVGQFDIYGYAGDVAVNGSYAYVADSNINAGGLEIIDISTPSSPVEVGQFYDGGYACGVAVSGSYAYVAKAEDGLEIIDISTPSSPAEAGQFDDGGNARSVAVNGSYVYVADGSDGLEILQIIMQPDLITVTNPTSSSTWTKGTEHSITWDHTGVFSRVKIELYENLSFVLTIGISKPNNGNFSWMVDTSLTTGTTYRIKVTSRNDSEVYDYSENFEIIDSPSSTPGFGFVHLMVGLLVCVVPVVIYRRCVSSSSRLHPKF